MAFIISGIMRFFRKNRNPKYMLSQIIIDMSAIIDYLAEIRFVGL
jgi:hypothetical protein